MPAENLRQRFVFKRSYKPSGGKCLVWHRIDVDDGTECRALADNFWSGRGPIFWYPGYDGGRIRLAGAVAGDSDA